MTITKNGNGSDLLESTAEVFPRTNKALSNSLLLNLLPLFRVTVAMTSGVQKFSVSSERGLQRMRHEEGIV